MSYIDEDCFPADYDWLTQEQQEGILRAVKEYREYATSLWRDYQNHKGTDQSEYFRQIWHYAAGIASEMNRFLLDVLNIHVEYGWCGHRGEYFLATYNDAVSENEYYYDIARDAEGDVDLCCTGGDYNSDIDY